MEVSHKSLFLGVIAHSPETSLHWNVAVQGSGQVFPCQASTCFGIYSLVKRNKLIYSGHQGKNFISFLWLGDPIREE